MKLPDRNIDGPEWEEWVKGRPRSIQLLCRKYPPDRLYRLRSRDDMDKDVGFTGRRVTISAYGEDGTLSVFVDAAFNEVIFERGVFGVKPDDIEECDLPDPLEPVGVIFTDPAAVDAVIDGFKASMGGEHA